MIGEPLPIVMTADTKLPVHTPAGFGPGSDWSRPTRFDEIHPFNCKPAPIVPDTLTSSDEQDPITGGGVTTGPVSFPLSVPVPGKFVGRLSLWSLNPFRRCSFQLSVGLHLLVGNRRPCSRYYPHANFGLIL